MMTVPIEAIGIAFAAFVLLGAFAFYKITELKDELEMADSELAEALESREFWRKEYGRLHEDRRLLLYPVASAEYDYGQLTLPLNDKDMANNG